MVLDDNGARELVLQQLDGSQARLAEFSIDADRVRLRLERPMDLPLVPPGWQSRTVVVADAAAWLRQAP